MNKIRFRWTEKISEKKLFQPNFQLSDYSCPALYDALRQRRGIQVFTSSVLVGMSICAGEYFWQNEQTLFKINTDKVQKNFFFSGKFTFGTYEEFCNLKKKSYMIDSLPLSCTSLGAK